MTDGARPPVPKKKKIMPIDTSEHAFPAMSLRDYFAGQALAGDLAGQHAGIASDEDAEFIAMRAYEFADAMLAARKKVR